MVELLVVVVVVDDSLVRFQILQAVVLWEQLMLLQVVEAGDGGDHPGASVDTELSPVLGVQEGKLEIRVLAGVPIPCCYADNLRAYRMLR